MSSSVPSVVVQTQARLDSLTKPPGSLGRLEEIVLRLAAIQQSDRPLTDRKAIYVFCGDHGVTAEGVSPFPSSVTVEMMRNFVAGGAAISVLCRIQAMEPVIVNAGAAEGSESIPNVLQRRIAPGTRNFAVEPAMTRDQAQAAIALGRQLAGDAASRFDLVGLGEMGIGNTTSAAALLSAFTGADPGLTAGAGTGLTPDRIRHKAAVIRRALALHQPDAGDALGVLAAVGGFEIAAMAGFLVQASRSRLAVVIDGFPCSAAALAARALAPTALDTAFFAHRSAETGHSLLLETLGASPLLDLGMRLGEGTGAALAMNVIDAAARLFAEMATFEQAQVSGRR